MRNKHETIRRYLYLFLCETNLAHNEEDVLSGKQCGGHCGEDAQEEGGQRGGEEEHVQPGEVRGGTHHTGHTLEYKENIFSSYRLISILFVGQISISIVSFVFPKILKMKLQTPSIKSCRCSLCPSSYGEQRAQSSALGAGEGWLPV